MWWLDAILIVVALVGTYVAGYAHGQHVAEGKALAEQERLRRLEPPRRSPGTPANTEAEPSEIRQPRWRNGQFREGPDTRHPRGVHDDKS
jgi:hypothetical protein